MVDESRVPHDVDPAHGADNKADPKGQHNEQQKYFFKTAGAAIEKIGGDITHDNAEKDSLKGDTNGTQKDFWIKEIVEKFGIIAKLESRDVRTARGTEPEAVDDDEANRNDEEQKNCGH